MSLPRKYRIDGNSLIEEIDILYQDFRDFLNLEFTKTPNDILRNLLIFGIEDCLNKRTSVLFKTHNSLVCNFLISYLEQENINLDKTELDELENHLIESVISETETYLRNIKAKHDIHFSKWNVTVDADLFVNIDYLGDYRIDQWHEIKKVNRGDSITILEKRLKIENFYDIFSDVLKTENLAISDMPILLEHLIDYYTGGQTQELYKEILSHLKSICSETRRRSAEYQANFYLTSIIKGLMGDKNFVDFVNKVKMSEKTTYNLTRSRLIVSMLMPGKGDDDLRSEIQKQMEENGYLTGDLINKVNKVYE